MYEWIQKQMKEFVWNIDGSMVTKGKPKRTQAVTSDQSEAFFILVQHNKFLVEELLEPRPTPILEDHLCRLSETSYSKHLQLPSAQEFVPTSATWGRAMPWRQRLIAQGKAEGIGERCLTAALSTMNLTMAWYRQSRSTGRKMSQYYFFHHKTPHEQTWDCNRACAVRTRRLAV